MNISPSLQDLVVGIVTSVITGVAVWLWQKFNYHDWSVAKPIFGLKPNDECLVVLGQHREQNATSHSDIDSMVEAVKVIHGIGYGVKIASFNKAIESPGESSEIEIWIRGPDSNVRTGKLLSTFFDDIHVNPHNHETDHLAIVTKKKRKNLKMVKKSMHSSPNFFQKQTGSQFFLSAGKLLSQIKAHVII